MPVEEMGDLLQAVAELRYLPLDRFAIQLGSVRNIKPPRKKVA